MLTKTDNGDGEWFISSPESVTGSPGCREKQDIKWVTCRDVVAVLILSAYLPWFPALVGYCV